MAEFEAHNLAQPGNVLVIQACPTYRTWRQLRADRQAAGEVGAIVEGGVRDVGHSRAVGYPVLGERHYAGHRQVAARENRDQRAIVIGGVQVHPGDLVVADDTGVCFTRATTS